MASLPTRSFSTIVQTIATGMQGRSAQLTDFAIGSVLRAMAEAYAGVALWLQSMVLQVLAISRLATSVGPDVDTFVADTGLVTRLGAQAATGQVTFSRITAGPSAPFIPVGATVQSANVTPANAIAFAVTADPLNGAYSAVLGGYTMPAFTSSLSVPVICITPDSGATPSVPDANGNVSAGAISVITSNITGIDSVTNVAAFTNGSNGESDSAVKARFKLAILGLAAGDLFGTEAAIEGAAVNVQFTITESFSAMDVFMPGSYFVVCDDGSGAPTMAFIAAVNVAVQSVRPLGIQATVIGPTITTANVSMTITTAAGFTHSVVVAQVVAALGTAINTQGLGNGLPYNLLPVIAFGVAGVTNVNSVLLNGGTSDIPSQVPGTSWQAAKLTTVKAGTLTVS